MMRTTTAIAVLALGLTELACIVPPGDVGELTDTDGSTAGSSDDSSAGASAEDTSGGGPPPSACGPEGPSCDEDVDHDCVGQDEDDAPYVYDPEQSDIDGDGIADVMDLCPTVPGLADDTADADGDGIGNGCDPCRRSAAGYNLDAVNPMGYMRVRNIATVADADGDGIGDACDNCVQVPNCEAYGPGMPWQPGDPIADGDPTLCQGDADADMVGDACAGMQGAGAAGPVGLGPDDDFDQDGLVNVIDACSRLPLTDAIACTGDGDCPEGRKCETAAGLCDHLDRDADGVGDLCDSCPTVENPMQVADGAMQEGDDVDGDFVGNACESSPACELRASPRRIAFYPVAVEGQCCTVAYRGDGSILDPDGLPVTQDCEAPDEGVSCRSLPLTVALAPGMVLLPPGCDAALSAAGLTVETHLPLTPDDVGGVEQLWAMSCQLPPLDQDFDGLADPCDLCPHAFDPENLPYIDAEGTLWPDAGKYCNGEYAPHNCG
ncbi:MAG: thrombospondin type 3 repeat-containing protein [Myxococcales bacterium]|nr:thrombospondin type 3 repeat-containing protein [Myxococcales bacterium]